jgi:1-acyl-sn-glycerol-3-phosphate acyltransferase
LSAEVPANKSIIDEHFDIHFTREISEYVVQHLEDYFFRPRFIGFENFPERPRPDVPLIFASNHSGMAFPWDGIILTSSVFKMFNYSHRSFRPLASLKLSASRLMNPFLYDNLWKIVGSVDASFLNFETMLNQSDHNVLVYPEGINGIGKGFDKRYQLQRFSSSFITLAIKYKTDIVPISTVNGEYINPLAYRVKWLNRLVNKIGIPYMPVGPVSMMLPLQPWIYYSALPARLTYVLGEKISPYTMTDKPVEEMTLSEIVAIKEEVKHQMQTHLNQAVKDYGDSPYFMKQFAGVTFKNLDKLPYSFPFGWPLLFSEFDRVRKKHGEVKEPLRLGFMSWLRILLARPFNIFFYLPIIGWLPILWFGMKRSK